MSRTTWITFLAIVTGGVFVVSGLTSPQGRLLTRIAAGHFEYAPAPVYMFTPIGFDETAVPIRIGVLRLSVPQMLLPPDQRDEWMVRESIGVFLNRGTMGFVAYPPHPDGVIPFGRESSLPGILPGMDEVSLESAAYSADPRKASPWMSRAQATELDALLSLRKLLVQGVERVEVVRGEGIKGMLLIHELGESRLSMVFEYYSTDERLSGSSFLSLDGRSPSQLKAARAIVSSFRLVPQIPKHDAGG